MQQQPQPSFSPRHQQQPYLSAQYPQQQQQQLQHSQPVPGQIYQQSNSASTSSTATNGDFAKTNKLATRYGDGFVSSASHPELAERYGNVGTSNPYTGAPRPGTAVVPSQA